MCVVPTCVQYEKHEWNRANECYSLDLHSSVDSKSLIVKLCTFLLYLEEASRGGEDENVVAF